MDVLASVAAEVQALPDTLRDGPDAAICLRLADEIAVTGSARDVAVLAKELRAALGALRAAAGAAADRGDGVDDLRSRREARRTSQG